MPEGADRRERASTTETCHAREREHPGCHDATSLAALRRFGRFPGSRRRFVASPRLDTRFRGYDTSWLGGSMQRLFRGAA
jgi:hypothetical protein